MKNNTISIGSFRRDISKICLLPSYPNFEHWIIKVEYDIEISYIYHADKYTITNRDTNYISKEWKSEWDIKSNIIVIGILAPDFNHEMMDYYCKKVYQDRIFNTLTNNCQDWVQSVLIELVKDKHLLQKDYDMLIRNDKMIPLKGW
jgi:hypothetical protein